MSLILASTSKIRKTILENAGLQFSVSAPHVDEAKLKANHLLGTALNLALVLAESKALSIQHPQDMIIGADQTLTSNGKTYDKPKSMAEARLQLETLRGQSHTLHAALAIAKQGKIIWRTCETASLTMRNFSDELLTSYLNKTASEIIHCVGCYQLEGEGAQLFDKIEGDYFTILGLPLLPLLAYLRQENYLTS
jgi:septum formation protein